MTEPGRHILIQAIHSEAVNLKCFIIYRAISVPVLPSPATVICDTTIQMKDKKKEDKIIQSYNFRQKRATVNNSVHNLWLIMSNCTCEIININLCLMERLLSCSKMSKHVCLL